MEKIFFFTLYEMYKCPSYYTMCQQSTVIFDYDSNRKVRDTSTSVKMPIDGQCPFCPWKCKSMNQSTFSMISVANTP